MHTQNKETAVYVALSGGVDSATAALLLQREGYNVVGVYMKTWSPPDQPCPWKEDKRDAMRVCARLGIPFKMWDFTGDYKEKVVDYMVGEYAAGRTPNPDVFCNKHIKFGLFFDKAMAEGANYVATGHHARIKKGENVYHLLRGADPNKDQSYFLWTLTQRQLEKTLFPVGEYGKKDEVRQLASTAGLPVADKQDSQGVCFIGPIDMQEFLAGRISAPSGPIKSVTGRELGTHKGLPFYTIGQREGIGIGGGAPYYVARKEAATNTLVVAPPSQETELMSTTLTATDASWVGSAPDDGAAVDVQVRYRQDPFSARLVSQKPKAKTYNWQRGSNETKFQLQPSEPGISTYKLEFEPVRAVTPGQSVVLYEGECVLGGGVIK